MKYLIITLFFFASATMFAQTMTRDYGYLSPKDSRFSAGDIYVGVLLGINSVPSHKRPLVDGDQISLGTIALKLVYNTDDIFFPLTIGRTSLGNYDFIVGAGYRKRFRKIFVHSSTNIRYTPHFGNPYWVHSGSTEYLGLGLNMGVTRELRNNLVLTAEFGPGIYRHTSENYNYPRDPITNRRPLKTRSTWLFNTAFTLAYRI